MQSAIYRVWALIGAFGGLLACTKANTESTQRLTVNGLAMRSKGSDQLRKVEVSYRDNNQLSLAPAALLSFTAKLQGGPACFGDLYDAGRSDNVTIDVESGEQLMIRSGADNCEVSFISLRFDAGEFQSQAGLAGNIGESGVFDRGDGIFLQVSVVKGLNGFQTTDDLRFELVGKTVDAQTATNIKNTELFVENGGGAYLAPAIGFSSFEITYFNQRVYAPVSCMHGDVDGIGCEDEQGNEQAFADMTVWLTNEDIKNLDLEERFEFLENNFVPDGGIIISDDSTLSGPQLASGDLGVTPSNFDPSESTGYLAIRMQTNGENTYKVFELNYQ